MSSGSSSPHRPRMLLGEQLRRRHDRRLEAVLHREQRAEQRHDRLAAADVALQQALHAAVAAHVGEDLAQHARLRAGERERQRLAERVVSRRLFSKRMPRRASRASALARCCSSCTNSSSSNASRARPSIASPSDDGRCTMRSASRIAGTAAPRSTSGGRYSVTRASSSSRCASMIPRITLNDSPSVAGYTESTMPSRSRRRPRRG